MDGFLNVRKPVGPTSHDVVSEIRRLAGTRQVGHSGTLDPMAEGVLVVALNRGTRALPFLPDTGKTYRAEMELGSSTDTQDSSGRTVGKAADFLVTREEFEKIIREFTGTISQIPPMYSAVKVGGRKLYELAREGCTIERRPREVVIESIILLSDRISWSAGDRVDLKVECSTGTYIRTLCHDIGQRLGCLAHMTGLVRERAGRFALHDSVELHALRDHPESLVQAVVSVNDALCDIPSAVVAPDDVRRVSHGNPIPARFEAPLVRLLAPDGKLLAIAGMSRTGGSPLWQPVKVFADQEGA